MIEPSIDVITVCFNDCEGLIRTLESVSLQEYPNIHHIVVDGGSDDGTLDLLRNQAGDVKWISEPDEGIYHAMNKGVSLATSEYCLFLNAGDVFLCSDAIASVVREVGKAVYDVIVCRQVLVSKKNRVIHGSEKPKTVGCIPRSGLPHQATLFSVSFHKSHTYNCSYSIAADRDLWYRISQLESLKIIHINMLIAAVEYGGVSTSWRRPLASYVESLWLTKKYEGESLSGFYLIKYIAYIFTRRLLGQVKIDVIYNYLRGYF